MKKLFFIIVVVCMFPLCHAQDTITQQSYSRYYYGWWRDTLPPWVFGVRAIYLSDHYQAQKPGDIYNFVAEMAQLFANTDTLKIIGIATAARNADYPDCTIADTDRNLCYEQLKLYRYSSGTLQLADQASFNIYYDTAHLFKFRGWNGFNDRNHPDPTITYYLPIYEALFDSTVVITDSFYIGRTFNNMRYSDNNLHPGMITSYWDIAESNSLDSNYWIPNYAQHLIRYHNDPIDDWYPFWSTSNGEQVVHPKYYFTWAILEEDSLPTFECPRVEGLNGIPNDTCLSLTWSGNSLHSRWEVAYSSSSDSIDGGGVRSSNTTFCNLCIGDSGTYYIRVRGFCDKDSSWGEWSDSLVFHVESHDVEGISRPSVVDAVTNVFPNPATYTATVTSSYQVKSVDIYSVSGQMISSQPSQGHSATIDVFNLPEGSYIMAVHTSKGIATKRLVVR